jgi:glycosyltransferase involved in cell wall biosynthesis
LPTARLDEKPRLIIITQRMHPNLRELHHMITSRGGECKFIVSRIGPSEPRTFPDRLLVNPRSLTKASVEDLLATTKTNLLVQRDFSRGNIRFWKTAGELGIPRFVYDQNPVLVPFAEFRLRPWRVIRLAKDLTLLRVRLGRHTRLSPVLFWGKESSRKFSNSLHVPFPMRNRAPKKPSKNPSATRVVCVAKHGQKRKRVAWLILALKRSRVDFTIDVVGSAPQTPGHRTHFEKLKKLAKSLGARSDLVTFHEDLSEEEIHRIFAQATAFVLPARREQMAISPLEAMSHGLPVLVASDGGASYYTGAVSPNQVFQSHSKHAFEKKLAQIVSDPDLRVQLGKLNQKAIQCAHSPDGLWRRINLVLGR